MERSHLLELMGELKLYGMKAAFDEIMATAVKRQHEPQRILGALLEADQADQTLLDDVEERVERPECGVLWIGHGLDPWLLRALAHL